ncbi:MAG: putative toxin-antitoxin system toxin component, PIN family [bacterium]|nr:putative toxin-antitoxin system toxin component, PIN family [bacterium]MDD5354723.1 putative toxin-antitoxin system toxin component, PIN family [bacterium]
MKILFDTNVLIAAFLSNGNCYDIVQSAVNTHEVFYTQYILKEFHHNFRTKFKFTASIIKDMTVFIEKHFQEGVAGKNIPDCCRDKDDNHILADADANGIDVIITGDKDLLVLKQYKSIKIISPKEYWLL